MGCLGWRFIPIFVLCLRILFIFFLVCSSELIPLALSNYPVEISISKKGSASGHLVANELFESIPHKKYTAQLKNLESPVRSPTNPTSRSKKKSEPEWNHSRTKKFSEKLKSFTSWAWNWLLNFFAKKTNKVEDESIRSNKSKEHQAGHLFAQSKFLPIEEIPFYEAIEPYYEAEKASQHQEILSSLQAISPENDPDMLIRRQVAFLLGKPVAKIKPQALDLQKENSIAETLLTEMTNPHRTIAQREAEYRIFVHLLRCTDDVNVRSKIEKIYTRNKGVQKSLKYGSIQAYVYSLKDKKNPEVQNLGNYMISFCESARWGEVVPDVEYMNKSQDLAYKILRSKNITILQKIPALKVLRILQCFDMGTDMTFREEISKDNYLLSVYALISYEEQPQKLSNKFNFNSWDHVALSEPNVAREFDRIKQAEAHGISSMFKKNPDITWEVKESDSRLKLMDSLVNLMLNNSKNYVQLLKLKEKYSIFFSKGWSEAHNIDLFPNDSFLLFRSADLEVREKVWLFKALDHFRNFGDTKMKEIVIRGLETEAENLTEVHNHLLMNKIILKNGAIQSLEFVNQKALVFRKLKYNTKIAELVSEVTLGEEIEGILFELKNQWSPLSSSKLQLYMILEHLVNNFPAIRDPEYWENMGKKFREPTIIKILKSLGQIANRDDSLSWMRSIGKGPVETDPQKTAGKNQLLELLCPEMDELQNFLATPLTGFGIGIYPDFSLDISFLKNLESKNPHTRAGIIYNGPAEKLQRRILIKTLKNNSSEDCRWMHNLANYMKKLNLITYWEKDTLNPINTPTLTTCLLSYLDSSNRSTSEGVILYRVLEHLMNNNLNVQSTVLEALRNDESLSHKLDQFYYMSLFENIGGNNIRTSILNLNEISMTVVNSPDNIRHDFVDSFFKQLSSILKSQQPPLQQSEVRVCALMIHYLYSRKVISPEEWISVLKMTPEIDEQILEIRLVLDSVEFPPLLEKLEENLTAKRFHKGLSEPSESSETAESSRRNNGSRILIDSAFKELTTEIEKFKTFGPKQSNVFNFNKFTQAIAENIVTLDTAAPWRPTTDIENPKSLYSIINETIRVMRMPSSPIWAIYFCDRVLNFVKICYPYHNSQKNFRDKEFFQVLKFLKNWKPIVEFWKNIQKTQQIERYSMPRSQSPRSIYPIVWSIVNSSKLDLTGKKSDEVSKLVNNLASIYVGKASTQEELQVSSDEAGKLLVELTKVNKKIREKFIQKANEDTLFFQKFIYQLIEAQNTKPTPTIWFSKLIRSDLEFNEKAHRLIIYESLMLKQDQDGIVKSLCTELKNLPQNWIHKAGESGELVAKKAIEQLARFFRLDSPEKSNQPQQIIFRACYFILAHLTTFKDEIWKILDADLRNALQEPLRSNFRWLLNHPPKLENPIFEKINYIEDFPNALSRVPGVGDGGSLIERLRTKALKKAYETLQKYASKIYDYLPTTSLKRISDSI